MGLLALSKPLISLIPLTITFTNSVIPGIWYKVNTQLTGDPAYYRLCLHVKYSNCIIFAKMFNVLVYM